jgi:hypothetical protein
MPDPTIQDAIESAAQNPRAVAFDGTQVQGQPIPDLIEADKYLSGKTARARNHLGVTFRQLEPGATG